MTGVSEDVQNPVHKYFPKKLYCTLHRTSEGDAGDAVKDSLLFTCLGHVIYTFYG